MSHSNPVITLSNGKKIEVLAYILNNEDMLPIVEIENVDTQEYDDEHFLAVKLIGIVKEKEPE